MVVEKSCAGLVFVASFQPRPVEPPEGPSLCDACGGEVSIYRLSVSESGGYRILLPPDPRPQPNRRRTVAWILAFFIGSAVGAMVWEQLGEDEQGCLSADVPASVS